MTRTMASAGTEAAAERLIRLPVQPMLSAGQDPSQRQAMIHYRALFEELVSEATPVTLNIPHAAE